MDYSVRRRCRIASLVNIVADLLAEIHALLRPRKSDINLSYLLPGSRMPSKFSRISSKNTSSWN